MSDKWHEIFIAGNYPQGSMSESYLDKTIANFERDKEAGIPLTLDHKKEGQAYGWVGELKRVGKKLFSTFSDVTNELKEAVREKRYKNISVAFHPKEPRLLEVSFLGARLPEIKSLPSPEFSLPDDLICIEFAENIDLEDDDYDEMLEDDYDSDDNKIERYRAIVKDQNEKIRNLETQLEDSKSSALEPETEREKEFAEDSIKYKAMFDESQRQEKETEINDFCVKGVSDGYYLPRILPRLKALMFSLAGTDEAIEFCDYKSQEEPYKENALDVLKTIITDGEPQYAFMDQEIVTDKPKHKYSFSENNDPTAIEFSEAKKIANERGISPNDPYKMSEIIREIANRSQKNEV